MEKPSRFSISPVEDKKNGISMGASIITRPLKSNVDMENGATLGETLLQDPGAKRKRSLVQLTREALPRMENYRNSRRAHKRPSLAELHGDHLASAEEDRPQPHREKSPTPEFPGFVSIKLGWIQGVLIPCLLNIWGVMLFLRISWIVGQAGIGLSLLIILISSVVCVITTLSMSAITTNGEVKGGGIYYIISRSLGPEFGASVGIIFAFANAVAASMNTIGFCDSLNNLLKDHQLIIFDNGINDVRLIGTIALIVMCVICAVGMDWESKAQNILVVAIVGAMAALIIGALVGPRNDEQIAQGFIGLNLQTITENWKPNFRQRLPSGQKIEQNFFTIFGIFFPSVTGIQAGANISGDLKDPATAIPKGTLLSLLISMLSYALMVVFSGAAALREATGDISDIHNLTALTNCSGNKTCNYGLLNSYYVMELMSIWGPLIYAGCFAATLSTALTNLLSVPRLIQALGIDGIYPGLVYFSKGYGKHGEPYRGYVLAFLVSLVFLLIGDLDTIAPLISNFYLTSYALINFCAFHAALVSPLGWRPTFKFYNVWLSLIGFLLCVGVMLMLNWITSLITAAIFFTLYLIVTYRNPDVNWGSSTQAQSYKVALASVWGLARTGEHVKNYWPQLLVLAGQPHCRPALIDLANLITKSGSLMFVAEITEDKLSYRDRSARTQSGDEWLRRRKVRAFTLNVNGFGFELGARALLQAAGLGRLAPNVLLMGYKADWASAPRHNLLSYFNVLHNAFENRLAVAILRLPGGLDYSLVTTEESNGTVVEAGTPLTANSSCGDLRLRQLQNILHADSDLDIHVSAMNNKPVFKDGLLSTSRSFVVNEKPKKDQKLSEIVEKPSKELLSQMNLFQIKQTDGTVDVWWLYDDGGLTMLIPYVIAQRSTWGRVRLRVFALASRNTDLKQEEKNMAYLLAKFRIEYASLTMVADISEQPQPETRSLFDDIIKNFTKDSDESGIQEAELSAQADKTKRQLRLRELLLANSSAASLIVMSLPMPRKASVSAALYMAWLEVMSRDLPPMLFIRGNQTSVLTVYS